MKSLLTQVHAMQRDWPQLEPTLGLGPQSVIWFGNLKGLERQFSISIEYGLPVAGRHNQ